MVTKAEIVKEIENTRFKINNSMDDVSEMIHEQLNLKKQIKTNPGHTIFIAALLGFSLAALATKPGRHFLKAILKPAGVLGTAYLSDMTMKILKRKIKEM